MHRFWLGLVLVIVLVDAEALLAQLPFPPQPAPLPASGPLMYVRFSYPKGAKITVYRGGDQPSTLELPATLGFRPGYIYRLAISDVPGFPRQVFCPSLEIRGTLALAARARNADFPATIVFNDEEFEKVARGAYVKKVVTLERPDRAIPVATKADEPLEIPAQPGRDPYVEAAERGQPLIVLHLGQRVVTPQELAAQAIPGTVLLPGDKVLGSPRVPPYLQWHWCPVYDPIHGPRHPSEFVTIYDGGDSGMPAGFDRFNRLKGLDPSDTIAEYTDSKGNRKFTASNRVGLCVPRFLIFKSEQTQAMQTSTIAVNNALATAIPSTSVGQLALQGQSRLQSAESMGTRLRLSGTFNTLGTSVTGQMRGVKITANLRNVGSVDSAMTSPKHEPEDGPLLIIKWPDKECVNVGDIVTFTVKYSNAGGQPITGVVVSDSLAARFEYVKGSTKTDRDSLFTTQPNEVGSTLLHWEFSGALQPREHGLITFQVRVR